MSLGLTFGAYWPLLLLYGVLGVAGCQSFYFVAASRLPVGVAILLEFTGPVLVVGWIRVVLPCPDRQRADSTDAYLLDVSQSVSPADIQSAIRWIRQTSDSGKPDHARYIPFGANARVFESLNQLEAVGVAENPTQDAIGQNATNIEVAVDSALENFDPHHLKRLVLITDGNENRGHVMNTIRRLQSENVRVYTMLLGARSDRDTSIESITAPPEVAAQEPFSVEVGVYSRIDTAAHVELRQAEEIASPLKQVLKMNPVPQRLKRTFGLPAIPSPGTIDSVNLSL